MSLAAIERKIADLTAQMQRAAQRALDTKAVKL